MPSSLSEGVWGGEHALESQLWSRPGTLGVNWSLVLQAGHLGSKDRANGGEKPSAQPCLIGKAGRGDLKSLSWTQSNALKTNYRNFKSLLGWVLPRAIPATAMAPGSQAPRSAASQTPCCSLVMTSDLWGACWLSIRSLFCQR